MIRPEVRDGLIRWREVIASLGLAGLGLWLALSAFGLMEIVGWAIALLGFALAGSAAQKLRFRMGEDGPGVVTLDERRAAYLGPVDGGISDLDALVQLDLIPSPAPGTRAQAGAWRLISEDGTHIDIPTNAKGVDNLFDAFVALPGMKTEYMLSVLNAPRKGAITVWMAPDHKPYKMVH